MKNMIYRFAEFTIRRYGFESPITIFASRLADLVSLESVDISDCPFTPDTVKGRPVLAIIGNKAVIG
jgi:hypothetical protein